MPAVIAAIFLTVLCFNLADCQTTIAPIAETTVPFEDYGDIGNKSITFYQCDFDSDFCQFSNDPKSNAEWMRYANESVGQYTGPNHDHTTGAGYYVLLDASKTYFGKVGHTARLVSDEIVVPNSCANITFWYHAYGFHLGGFALKVNTQPPYSLPVVNWTTIFETKGHSQITRWRFVQVLQKDTARFKLAFEAAVGEGPQGNYAFDDLEIKTAYCPTTPSPLQIGNAGRHYYRTTSQKPPETIQAWIIALIVILVVSAIAAAGIAVFIFFRQKKLKILKEQQDKEKAERLKREIDQFGMIRSRLDRTISGQVALGLAGYVNGEGPAPKFDRPLTSHGMRRAFTAGPAVRTPAGNSIYDNDNSNNGNPNDAVYVIAGDNPDFSASISPRPSPRPTRSAIARNVHQIEDTSIVAHATPPSRLPPIPNSPRLGGEGDVLASPRRPSSGRHVTFDASVSSPTKPSSSKAGKAEKMDWFEDDEDN